MRPSADPVVELRHATVRFACATAIEGVSLSVRGSEIMTLIGPNGARSSTVVNRVLGMLAHASLVVTGAGLFLAARATPILASLCRAG